MNKLLFILSIFAYIPIAICNLENGEFCDPPYGDSLECLKHKVNSEIYYIHDYLFQMSMNGYKEHSRYFHHQGKLKAYQEVKKYLDKVNSEHIPE